ncbi:hypothetical protein FSARC_8826 [Fusarium sarcochroum]|uniref:glucan 1,3-beta-glucosidase n=1 Tax=Fusarium sarcochroum TaxID=1208366 RepID=A0A8H4TSC2_9HYPO|nr:hypothetical protein FSARC_8826 [Fusarium sarcochroum]
MKLSLLITALVSVTSALPEPSYDSVPKTPAHNKPSLPEGNWNYGPYVDHLKDAQKKAKKAPKKYHKFPYGYQQPSFVGWNSFKAYGPNLGGWLLLERGIEPKFFTDNGAASAQDEWNFCKVLGKKKCGRLLEQRYATWFTEKDVDLWAQYGVNTIRIPVGYWAFMKPVNGDTYYHGNQLKYLAKLANYAIQRKNMHIVLDLHGLPGGQNGLDNQGKIGDLNWWNNQTNFDHSIDLVRLATQFIQRQPRPDQYTLGLVNEPLMQGPAFFGQTDESIAYLNKYYKAALKVVRKLDPRQRIPVMLSDGFAGPNIWDQWWANSKQNIVFDTHIYYFIGGSYPQTAPYEACYLAKSYENATNPVFIGEWSIQATSFNSKDVATRKNFFYSQAAAYEKYLNGGTFWSGKHFGTNVIGDKDGSTQESYWSFTQLIKDGVIVKRGQEGKVVQCNA